jgi:hypothetical protein
MVFHYSKFDKELLQYMFDITWLVLLIWFAERASRNIGIADFLVSLYKLKFNKFLSKGQNNEDNRKRIK